MVAVTRESESRPVVPDAVTESGGAAVVAEAPDIAQARIWIDALGDDGIKATYFERGPSGAFGGASLPSASYAVLVGRHHIGQARSIIADLGGTRSLVAYRSEDEEREGSQRVLGMLGGGVLLVGAAALALRAIFG